MSKFTATETHKYHLSVGAILLNDDGQYVLLDEMGDGRLGMMTGTVEDNESLEQCLHRELLEEVGATCEITGFSGSTRVSISDDRGAWEKTILWFSCRLASEPTRPVVRVKSLDAIAVDPGRWPFYIL